MQDGPVEPISHQVGLVPDGRVEPIAGGTLSPSSGIGAGEVKKRTDYRGQIAEDGFLRTVVDESVRRTVVPSGRVCGASRTGVKIIRSDYG